MDNIDEETIKIVRDIYFDPEYGLGSAQDIYNKLNKKISLNKIKLILKNIENFQQNKKDNSYKNKFIPIVNEPGTYQIDLTFYTQFKDLNNGYHILLTIININSKYAYVYPLKNKNADIIVKVFKQFLDQDVKDQVKNIEGDKGLEWNNSKFKKLLDDHNIKLFLIDKTISPNAISIVERFNLTIRNKIDKYMKSYKTSKFIDVLDKLVKNYNNSVSQATGYKPSDIDKEIEQDLYIGKALKKMNLLNEVNNEIKVGMYCRILKNKKLFSKGAEQYYSKGIYEIIGKEENKFIIKNIENGKTKYALPYQIQIIKKDELINNPYLQKDDKKIKKEKEQLKDVKKENKVNRALKRDGILDTVNEIKKEEKINKKLKRQGLNKDNIIK